MTQDHKTQTTVLDLQSFRAKRTARISSHPTQKNAPLSQDVAARMARIQASIQRINALMQELGQQNQRRPHKS